MRTLTALLLTVGVAAGSAVQSGLAGTGARPAATRTGPPPGSGTGPEHPLRVRSATLSQDGQELVWHIELAQSFSPGALARDHRALCLLLERPGDGSAVGQACVTGPAPGARVPRLMYASITRKGAGAGQPITARVDRSSTRELTAHFLPQAVGRFYSPLRWQVISALRPPACMPYVPDRVGCYVLFMARPALLSLHVPLPVGCVAAGPSLVFNGSRNQRDVALTFDDGPWPYPPASQFLDVLERYHAVATFFEIGRQIQPYDPGGRLERRMLADGDMIGNHTWTHPDMRRLSSASQRHELEQTSSAIKAASGFTPCFWRPPYGAFNSGLVSLARSLGLATVNWDVDTQDYTLPGTATIYSRAVSGARNGSVILQHFGGGPRYETLAAVSEEISTLRQRGYRFVTVAQLLGLRVIYK